MKVLTVLSTIVIPALLVTSMYGMNVKGLPFADSNHAVMAVGALTILFTVGLLVFLRKQRWLEHFQFPAFRQKAASNEFRHKERAPVKKAKSKEIERVITGIPGLDDILSGGLPQGQMYLLEGDPGRERQPSPCSSCWQG